MGREVRRRGRRRAAAAKEKNKNWFMKLKMWQRVLLCTVGVLICTFSAAAIYVAAKWGKIQTQDIEAKDLIINEEVQEKNGEINLGKGYTNIALFGVDSRDGNLGKGNRTDCIIVASLNNETKEVKMISVYRDTLLDLSDGTLQKCNAAYSYGGPTQAVNMLNLNLDLDIQKYVTVDFGAIADAIDLLGGVEIEIKEEEIQYLNKFVQETADSAGKEAHRVETAGLQLLDGVQATTYARIRSTAGGDFTRTERQHLVIEKIVEKAKNADLMTLNAIIDKVFPQVATNFTLSDILYYAQAYTEYQLSGNMGFPQDKSTDTISGLGSIVIPEDLTSNVSALHQFLYGVNDYSPSSKVNSISEKIAARVGTGGNAQDSGNSSGKSDSSSTGGTQDRTYNEPQPSAPDDYEPTVPDQPSDNGNSGTDPGTDSGTGDGNPGADTGETDPGDSSGDSSGTGENGGQL